MRRIWLRGSLPLALAGMLLAATAAFGAARLEPGALYTGKSAACGRLAGTTCVFRFRAGRDGRSLLFVGRPVFDVWRCRGGGGEAILGGRLRGVTPTPIPLATERANGSVSGSMSFIVRSVQGRRYHHVSRVTGQVANGGRTVVMTFHDIYLSGHGSVPCATAPVTLTRH